MIGFYRGLWIPLMTISFVRASLSFVVVCSCLTLSCATLGAASFTIYTRTKEYFRDNNMLARDRILDVAASGGVG